jgi:hypothetical protein
VTTNGPTAHFLASCYRNPTTHNVPERAVYPGLSPQDSLAGCLVAVPVVVTGVLFVAQDLCPRQGLDGARLPW